MHLVLGVEVEKAVETRLDTIVDQAGKRCCEKRMWSYKRVSRQGGDNGGDHRL